MSSPSEPPKAVGRAAHGLRSFHRSDRDELRQLQPFRNADDELEIRIGHA